MYKKIFRNPLVYRLILQILFKLLATVTGLYTTRWLVSNTSDSSLANFYILIAYSSIILNLINLGIPLIIQKTFVSANTYEVKKNVWSTLLIFRFITYFAGLLTFIIFLPLSGISDYLLGASLFTMQYMLILDQNFRGYTDATGKTWLHTLTDLFAKVSIVFGLLLFSLFNLGVESLYYFILISFVAYIIMIIFDFRLFRIPFSIKSIKLSVLKNNSKTIVYLTASTVLVALYSTTDRLFLKNLGYSYTEISAYGNAYKLFEISTVMSLIAIPTLASKAKEKFIHLNSSSKNSLHDLLSSVSIYILATFFLGLIIMFGSFIFGPLVLSFIDPQEKYTLSKPLLLVLSTSLIPLTLNTFISYTMILFNKEKIDLYGNIFVLILSLFLYYFLIDRYGAYGAAWSTTIVFTAHLCFNLVVLSGKILLTKSFFKQTINL